MSAFQSISQATRANTSELASADHVTIAMATLNGSNFIAEQLASLANQSHKNWSLIVSDDGSSDATCKIVRKFAEKHSANRVLLLRGPQQGTAQNFLSLLRAAGRSPYLAFCDQDDVWLPDKLARALSHLEARRTPSIYGSRTMITNCELAVKGLSPLFGKPPSFGNSLVQNIAGGNTMVLNRPALDVLQPASLSAGSILAHDWWCYQMVTGIGGRMIYDPQPSLFYRQHSANQVGANSSVFASARRVFALLNGQFANWIEQQTTALAAENHRLTPSAREDLGDFLDARAANTFGRVARMHRSRIYRQTTSGTAALWCAVVLGRL